MAKNDPVRPRRPVTMQDVASAAGVTTATVSLALNRSPKISPATRDKVIQAANRLGYERNPYVSALMAIRRERTKGRRPSVTRPVLALCTAAEPRFTGFSSSFLHPILESAERRAEEKGYRLDTFNLSDKGMTGRRATGILYTRNISGVLLAAYPELRDELILEWNRFSVVSVGFAVGSPALNRVACDPFQSLMTAMERCHRSGCGRIGLVLADDENPRINRRWLAAYLMEQERSQRSHRLPPLLMERWDDQTLFAWLRKHRPEALVVSWAGSLKERIETGGWKVPEELGLISLNSPTLDGTVSGIYPNPAILAARAVDMLVDSIDRNERGSPAFSNTLFVKGVWNPGKTLVEQASERVAAIPVRHKRGHYVSMRDLATELNMHVSTVSLSLRDSTKIPPATRKRVREAAEKFGYRNNPYISLLMTGKRSGKLPKKPPRLAFVTSFPTRDGWRRVTPTIAAFFTEARARAEKRGFRMEEIWLPPVRRDDPRFSEELRRRSIQGLMFASLPAPDLKLDLHWDWFCLVAYGFTLSHPPIHRAVNDHYSSMRRAVRECARLGYRRIGLALKSTSATANVQNRWSAAYLMECRELGGLAPLKPLVAGEWTKQVVSQWMEKVRPEVIVSPNASPLLHRLRTWGYAVPGDLGFVSLSCPKRTGSLSGIYQNTELLGARATDILINLIERNEYGIPDNPGTLMVDGVWNPGKTAGPPKQRTAGYSGHRRAV